jgi:hypothetical protein
VIVQIFHNMAKTVDITAITGGTQPYDIWVCEDCSSNVCQYITTVNDADLPYDFTLPSNFENLSSYTIRIIDNNDCITCNTF